MWRVQEQRAFHALRTHSRVARSKSVWIRRIDNPRDRIELAFAVGRRYGSAVERNRFRRRCRAIAQELAKSGDLMNGVYLIGATPAAKHMDFEELSEQIRGLVGSLSPVETGSWRKADCGE